MRVTVSGLFLMTGDLAPLTRHELNETRRLVARALVESGGVAGPAASVVLCETIDPDGVRLIMCCIELQPSAVRPARVYGAGESVMNAARGNNTAHGGGEAPRRRAPRLNQSPPASIQRHPADEDKYARCRNGLRAQPIR